MGELGEWLPTVQRRGVPILSENLGQMELFHNQVALGGGDSLRSIVETLHQAPTSHGWGGGSGSPDAGWCV